MTDSQTFSFIHEMQVWLAQVLLTGFLDRYPKLKMAVFESNAEWLRLHPGDVRPDFPAVRQRARRPTPSGCPPRRSTSSA